MSSIFSSGGSSSPVYVPVPTPSVQPEIVDQSQEVRELERKRKKKMGAVSQLLSHDNSYGVDLKKTLGD